MAYLYTPKINFPLEKYQLNSYKFKESCTHKGIDWGIHLGEDINQPAGTKVYAIGRGKVIYSQLHPGTKTKSNWGNILIIAHKKPQTEQVFFSLYAHLDKPLVKKRQKVQSKQILGKIAKANTPENGWWGKTHLHFGIYLGLWGGKVLPGYWKKNSQRTKLSHWQKPSKFIQNYQK